MNNQVILYQPNEGTRLEMRLADESVWATEARIGELFGVDRSVIYKHIHNIYKTGELESTATCAKIAQVQIEGKRTVTRHIPYYNLDVIIAVGYRVNSLRATRFRIWATKVLKEMLLKHFNDVRRLDKVECRMDKAELAIGDLKRGMKYLVEKIAAPEPPAHKPILGFSEGRK